MKLKPFDLEAAKAGAKVVTRCGYPARIICTDRRIIGQHSIIALVSVEGEESVVAYAPDGSHCGFGKESGLDLFIAPPKQKKWQAIYRMSNECEVGYIYESEEDALRDASDLSLPGMKLIAIVPVEWEE